MLERVLLPIEGESTFRRVFDYAKHLGQRTGASVTVLTVVERAEERDRGTVMLDGLLDNARVGRTAVSYAVRVGRPASEICAVARDGDASLLVMGTRAARPVGEVVFGSVAGEVLRGSGRPMLLVGPGYAPSSEEALDVQRLLVCLDGSEVSEAILPVVRDFAASLDLSVLLYFVGYPLVDEPTPEPVLSREERDVALRIAQHAAELRSHRIDADHRVESGTWPAESIVQRAASTGIDIIAMATHGKHALVRMLTGSTTNEVLRRAGVPVLTVRPSWMLH